MADFYKGVIPILDTDGPFGKQFAPPKGQALGMVPRDYKIYPEEMFAPPSSMKIIPQSEWDARYDEQERLQSSLEHIFLSGPNGTPAFENLDQNGDGYCWKYSGTQAHMIKRLAQNQKLVRFNPHAGAAIIKKGANEGGWCGLGQKFSKEIGEAVEGTGPGQWPLHSRNLKYDTPELRKEMAKYKVQEDFYDLTRQVWDQDLTNAQIATCSFNNDPTPEDYNWWGHSVCGIRHVRLEAGSWGRLILNSWKGWGRYGLAVLRGSQAIANGSVATLSVSAA